ncbi:ACR257Cp [Eremothecium gossypii ATCC 10895]|uniref:GTP-binding protein RHO4 n=1 Tax=Eremothecium gossypii (strain ATCC 10895 / CBS 109.51 / FGSC 9923 / NRRL Y-1056) TaxID=284811 RepID=RHO4_EREGS|nr:ACR257Cp [Eremothecium gossypii ATCC 10895]Q9P8V0.1 RecName: Full=GTP-binding protein RHO4; Flags: Precursor [Eremothecium gossypii ATCC 10895]AAF44725.1 Rho4 [Eremothecium gossypii]AAS51483.1 ACR257Cp [Eremothecium gossypii ATCC 10895]AEY95775.1 FACR257Cp [Eremothecium gossypii FDAG1]
MSAGPLQAAPKKNYGALIGAGPAVGGAAFNRTLSEVASYERSRRDHATPDYRIKIVVVGDGATGKTSLLMSYTQGQFPEDYVPTIFENYVTNIEGPRGKVIELALWDTAGQEEYSRLRPLSYGDVDIVMVCYAADNRTSLTNAEELWFPEVRHFCPHAPMMLVGLKSDLYSLDALDRLVDPTDAELVARKMGAFVHLQCSAKTRQCLEDVFNTAIHTALYDELRAPPQRGVKGMFKKKQQRDPQAQSYKRVRKHRCVVL